MMQVFLSWSGEKSAALAEIFHHRLPLFLHTVKTYYSPNMEKGAMWANELASQLSESSSGLLLLTPENLHSSWILFEAGALSRVLPETRICTFLYKLKPTDVEFPLAQFQHTQLDKSDLLRLLKTLNKILPEPVNEPVLETTFEKFWPELESDFLEIEDAISPSPTVSARSSEEQIEEILDIARTINTRLSTLELSLQEAFATSETDFKDILLKRDAGISSRLEELLQAIDKNTGRAR